MIIKKKKKSIINFIESNFAFVEQFSNDLLGFKKKTIFLPFPLKLRRLRSVAAYYNFNLCLVKNKSAGEIE